MRTFVQIALAFVCLAYAAQPHAIAKPIDQLRAYEQQLRATPTDLNLRHKLIAFVLRMKPAPAVPERFHELLGKGTYIFKNATGPTDFTAAVQAYNDAALEAPWIPDVYFDLGTAQEKAQQFTDAIASFRLYLYAAPRANDADAVRQRIGGLQFAADKAAADASAASAAAQQKQQQAIAVASFKNVVYGSTYYRRNCISAWIPGENGIKTGQGCNFQEYSASNWRSTSGTPVFAFFFPDDGTIVLRFISGNNTAAENIEVRGTPVDASLTSLVWECPTIDLSTEGGTVTGWKPAWVRMDTTATPFLFIFSCDRPRTGGLPDARYNYTWVDPSAT